MNKIFKTIALLFFLFSQHTLFAQNADILEKYRSDYKQTRNKGLSALDSLRASYDEYANKLRDEHNDFVARVEQKWGKENAAMSESKTWVEYGENQDSRTSVDFEEGKAKIEILVSSEKLKDKAYLNKKLVESVKNLLSSRGKTIEYESEYVEHEELSEESIMADLIDVKQYTYDSSVEKIAEAIVESESAVITKTSSERGEMYTVSITPDMVGDYIYRRAKKFEPLVLDAAKRFAIDPSLIYAIIETESSFNPDATSHIPAYGLMQIVPKYAGLDVVRYLYGVDKYWGANYLFKPQNNIEAGVCYLHLLEKRHFKGIEDLQCRELCMAAAYNTGAGNVSRAMVGHRNVSKAISKINTFEYDELYDYLYNNLPIIPESPDYIKKVTEKRKKYIAK